MIENPTPENMTPVPVCTNESAPAAEPRVERGTDTATATSTRVVRPRLDRLPPWKVLLHNDDESDMLFVVDTIVVLGVAPRKTAIERMLEAHEVGCAHLVTTHRERAELLEEQFRSKGLVVTIEPE